jgi:site-specific recombinase XerD
MKWFKEVETHLGIKAHAYALRHTYITNALIRGVPVEVLAELVGNTPQVLHRHYAHVAKDTTALKAAALKAVGAVTEGR